MVKGLEAFKRHFADYSDCYIFIGGSACDVNFSRFLKEKGPVPREGTGPFSAFLRRLTSRAWP